VLYDLIAALMRPSAWWGRMKVTGLEALPAEGPVLVVPNHDSQWDPIVIGLAAKRRRRLRYLARASLWRFPGLGPILNGLGQIPVRRGTGDAAAIEDAVAALRSGDAVCVFPEGGLSWGEPKRARAGVGRLAQSCPGARVVCCAVSGATGYVRLPRRPRVTVRFFEPESGQPRTDEEPRELAARLLAEIRDRVPPAPAGRRGRIGPPRRVVRKLEASPPASRS
jgi:1-acyl-sn-glycerol-3-phosphate acyltransferase